MEEVHVREIELLFAIPVAALAVFLSPCAVTPPASMPGVRLELAPTGTLRVAVFTGNPVLGTRDKASGEVTGTTVTMGRALAARAGVPAKIIEYTAIAKLVEDAKVGEWDIAVVAFDPARRNVVDFAPPHIVVDLTFLVAPGSSIRSVAEADRAGVNIAAARGAATALYLQRELKQAQVMQAENEPAAFKDRKSTRLNSSHLVISYAVFCLKKKHTNTPARSSRRPENFTDSTKA